MFHHPSAVRDALSRIVVSADYKDLHISRGKRDQKVVEEIDRLHRRNRFVIDIPGDDHRVRMLPVDQFDDPVQNIFLIFDHGKSVHTFSQV